MTKYLSKIKKTEIANFVHMISLLISVFIFFACESSKSIKATYLGNYTLPATLEMSSVVFGGISGLDYDSTRELFYLISDDRSKHGPARMYEAKLKITENGIDSLSLDRTVFLSDFKGNPFALETCDFETIRYIPQKHRWVLGNEGGRKGNSGIYFMDVFGKMIDSLPIENHIREGLRFNKTFEGIFYSAETKTIFYAFEAPLTSDGEVSTPSHGGMTRIIASDLSGLKKKEWIYPLEKVTQRATETPPWGGDGADNGLTELIYINKNEFLVLERSGAYRGNGAFNYSCKVFYVSEEVHSNYSKNSLPLINKKLLIDFDSIPNGGFNIEGMSFGPKLNGNKTLLFVSDNNFKNDVSTQFYLFLIGKNNG